MSGSCDDLEDKKDSVFDCNPFTCLRWYYYYYYYYLIFLFQVKNEKKKKITLPPFPPIDNLYFFFSD